MSAQVFFTTPMLRSVYVCEWLGLRLSGWPFAHALQVMPFSRNLSRWSAVNLSSPSAGGGAIFKVAQRGIL